MKITSTIILICICIMGINAQSYKPFAVEGAHWQMSETYCYQCDPAYPPYPNTTTDYCFKLNGDTLVNNTSYKQLYLSSTTYFEPNAQVTQTSSLNWSLIGLIREDTLLQKVYIRGITGYNLPADWCGVSNAGDSLLFDFSHPLTDSFMVRFTRQPGSCLSDSFLVNTTDTENIYGATRRVMVLNDSNEYYLASFRLIEGIGYSYGLFGNPGPSFEGNYVTTLTGYCVGPDSLCGVCYTKPVGIADLNLFPKINIYPNPADDYITITTSEIINQVIITDISGKIILTQNFDNNKISIHLSGLSKGMYICKIYLQDGEANRLIVLN